MPHLTDRVAAYRDKLTTISSDLGIFKGTVEDAGATEAAVEIERAQDCVDGALECLRAALQYANQD